MASPRRAVAVLLLASILAVPAAAAQAHDHGTGGLTILHDVRDTGETFAGNLDHFGVLLRGEDGVPAFHSDVEVEVLWNGEEMWSMASPSGHDYDALWTWAQSFPGPGSYEVRARVPGGEWQAFSGVVGPGAVADAPAVELVADVPATAMARSPVTFTASLEREGAIVPHSDIEWRVYDEADHEVFRVQTHIHADPVSFDYAFPQAGDYKVAASGFNAFPSADGQPFPQVLEVFDVTVDAGLLDLPNVAVPAGVLPENRVVTVHGDALVLHGTYDPFTSVGIGQPIRFGVIVTDADGNILPHVDMQATITGPAGVVFESASLHEYDGVAEIVTTHHDLGMHTLTVTASRGEDVTIELPYEIRVIPTAVAIGPATVTVDGPTAVDACDASDFLVSATDLLGQPYQHAEVGLLAVAEEPSRIVLATKLHTHETGTFPFRMSFPSTSEGGFLVSAAGTTPDLAGPGLLDFAAAGGSTITASGSCASAAWDGPAVEESRPAPAAGALVAFPLLAAALVVRRRR